ncbi:ribonuclease H-like domain-containing protein [Tanacetum coccineum]
MLEGVDVDETFSPVVKPGTIRTVLSLAASRHWPIHRLDIKNAFLHGDLSETVYMHQPPGFWDYVHPDYVCLLQRSLYGLKQALELGFSSLHLTLLGLDFLIHIIRSLHQEFAMTDLGLLNYFLGISVIHDSSGLFLSQKKYAIEILEKAHMVNCNPSRTPVNTESNLGDDGDLACLYMHDLREPHFAALKRILRVEAKYRGVANAVAETCCAIYLSCNLVQHQHTKHIKIDILFVRDLVATGQVQVLHVPSRYQFADIFTKDCRQLYLKNFALV